MLVLIVPAAIVRPAIDSAGAPERARPAQLSVRRGRPLLPDFGETSDEAEPVAELSAGIVTLGFAAAVLGLLGICWLRYRRLEDVE